MLFILVFEARLLDGKETKISACLSFAFFYHYCTVKNGEIFAKILLVVTCFSQLDLLSTEGTSTDYSWHIIYWLNLIKIRNLFGL